MEDSRLTPSVDLPGELFDVEERDAALREVREMEGDLSEMAQDEFDAWVASMEKAA